MHGGRLYLKALLLSLLAMLATPAWPQRISGPQRDLAQDMLASVAGDVTRLYYDQHFHGVDWNAKVQQTKESISKAETFSDAATAIAALLETLDDSHTAFIPPERTVRIDYGWRAKMIGAQCLITYVRTGSDAEAKGLKVGDRIVTIAGFEPTRESFVKMWYSLLLLAPRHVIELGVVSRETKRFRSIDVKTDVWNTESSLEFGGELTGMPQQFSREMAEKASQAERAQSAELGTELMVIRLPRFGPPVLGELIDKAQRHQTLILDFRGNQGGLESSLREWLGVMFPNEVKIADRVARSKTTTLTTKRNKHAGYSGKLIVLVDSQSASAAELFTRVIQLEKRGTILGDMTAGRTMEAIFLPHRIGGRNVFYTFAALVTVADLVMADGKSLEHVGVHPDEIVLPSGDDLASGTDPVLARAAELAGVKLDPASAGKLFSSR